ncbi:unknown [Bacteroides sp. CAG:714]|jgi:hypothetical protein|nr:unknown [Bacteroides sp. CAG:714]
MKTLDEILKRDDYSRLSERLKERVEELAKKIRIKMYQLDLDSLGDIHIRTVTSHRCGYSEDFLATNEGHDLESVNRSYYYCNDYSLYVKGASNKEALGFLNRIKQYIETLDEIETEKSQAIEKALEENRDIEL